MRLSINNQQVESVRPRYAGQEIIIAIDSSKTNSAMVVGDTRGNVIDYVELNGKYDGKTEEDTLRLCKVERDALTILLKGSKPIIVGIENIITKRQEGAETGMTIHESRFKITAVFMSFISFFQDTFGITPELVNNWTWKSAILPEQFRKKDVGKGSLAYFKSIKSKYQYCTDDVTDAVCIFMYLCKVHSVKTGITITEPEPCSYKHKILLTHKSFVTKYCEEQFYVNEKLTLEQNVKVMSNYLGVRRNVIAAADVRTAWIEWSDLYKYCHGTFNKRELTLKLLVVNEV